MKGRGGAERGREQTPDQLAWASSSRQGVTWSGGRLAGAGHSADPSWLGTLAGHLTSLPLALLGNGFTDDKMGRRDQFLRRSLGEMKCPKCGFLDKAAPWGGVWGSSKEKT